jgi:hypothetical protein
MSNNKIATFFGTYSVMKAEKLLKKNGVDVEAIAAPRHISTDCGICIRFPKAQEGKVRTLIASANVEMSGMFDE